MSYEITLHSSGFNPNNYDNALGWPKRALSLEKRVQSFTSLYSNPFLSVLHVNKALYNFYKRGKFRMPSAVFVYVKGWSNNLVGNKSSISTDYNVFLSSVLSNVFI